MKKRKMNVGFLSVISPILFRNLRNQYFALLNSALKQQTQRKGINFYSEEILSAIPLVMITWEALLNEIIQSLSMDFSLAGDRVWVIKDQLLDFDIRIKTEKVFEILAKRKIDFAKEPFQHFQTLKALRNFIVHFKFDLNEVPSKDLQTLHQYNLSISNKRSDALEFPNLLFSSEIMRWSVNLLADMSEEYIKGINNPTIRNLVLRPKIRDDEVKGVFRKLQTDPDSECY